MRTILFIVFFLAIGCTSIAQNKVVIVNNADSSFNFEYYGLFNRKSKQSIPCYFNAAKYAEERLASVLKNKYEVTISKMSSELHKGYNGTAKNEWLKSLASKYDIVIVVSSTPYAEYNGYVTTVVLYGSGLYSVYSLRNDIYTTIFFDIYNTTEGRNIVKYENPILRKTTGYIHSDTKNEFNPAMCDLIINEVKNLIKENIVNSLEPLNLYNKSELIAILNHESTKPAPVIDLAYNKNISDSILVTGWYYTTDEVNGFSRKLDKSEETYFIDPMPIVTKENFSKVEVYQTDFKGTRPDIVGLNTILDDYGRTAFAFATYKSVDRHVALIINNKLVCALLVKAVLNDGYPFLQRKEYNLSEIQAFAEEMSVKEL